MAIRFEALGHNVEFDCNAREMRSGFAHDATIIIDGWRWRSATCYYLNRTWEAWRFQSVCLSCVANMIEDRIDEIKEKYRGETGVARISGKCKMIVKDIVDSDEMIILLREIKRILNENSF